MFKRERVPSSTWLGAGKLTRSQPTTLYAASQVAIRSSQIVSRLRLPGTIAFLRVDTIDLVFDFLADQSDQRRNVGAVEIARVAQLDRHFPSDATGPRV